MFCTKCGKQNTGTSSFCTKCGSMLKAVSQRTPQPSGAVPVFQDLTGHVIDGKYQLTAKIGTGGMGDVYRANRIIFGDEAAIKVLHLNQSQNPHATERFRKEAKTSAKFKHINAVAIYDIGATAQGSPYLVMELVQGKNLRQMLRDSKTIPLELIVTITMQTCAALDEAHRLGIIHRDIKPENIVVSRTSTGWQVKVLDFGIAKVQGEIDSNLTLPGNAMGTPQYMSPEQCLGEQLDSRSDIYSFAIVLYEMLCGVVPFRASVPSAIVVQHVNEQPKPPSTYKPDVAPGIDAILLRALEKKRENRTKTAGGLAREFLQAVTSQMKSGNAPPSSVETPAVEAVENGLTGNFVLPIPEPTEALDSGDQVPPESAAVIATANASNDNADLPRSEDGVTAEEEHVRQPDSDDYSDASVVDERRENTRESADFFAELQEIISEVIPAGVTGVAGTGGTAESESREQPPTQNLLDPTRNLTADLASADVAQGSLLGFPAEAIPATELVTGSVAPPTSETNLETEIVSTVPVSEQRAMTGELNLTPEPKAAVMPRRSIPLMVPILAAVFVICSGVGISALYFMRNGEVPKPAAEKPAEQKQAPAVPDGMVYVPGGEFMMGNDNGDKFEKPAIKTIVKPFYIDIYEVTCTDYKKFLDATGYRQPQNWSSRDIPAGWDKRPVTGVNWDDANAYAKWAAKRLPTEAEWEFAARGTDGRIYPWGNDWAANMANAGGVENGMKDVGSYQGKSPYGAYDMVGNAWEWTSDDAKFYEDGKSIASVTKTLSPKIIRGGYFKNPQNTATVTFRRFWGARDEETYENSGFRCVKD